ncbi:MAG: LysR family transcriptional regulator [Bacteroidetes bacterium]|jgi:LysR family hydrogen peroxide-inducible transcriptional activator|nr:LysR family transcriptional regulator [Bacteroidota bacterium]MBU1577913.1 LysR family transcriptional regulator [Bacteroidota bacterium]MBU2558726.1 LysR family transcriptional regulator [Bacteroidota bacterium]MDA3944791.1 LysR substrate-binding domain-containing protein [Bacteroidota bacterium]
MITLTQLEYIVAIDSYRNFSKAAEKCFVTQPTLSMQVKKLEEHFGIKIFDRGKQPLVPTNIGRRIIDQSRVVLSEAGRLDDMAQEYMGEISGELNIGIIPTLAPYLLPLFAGNFKRHYPDVNLRVVELVTDQIAEKLKNDTLDVGVFVTPYNDPVVLEEPLFYEEMLIYAQTGHPLLQQQDVKIIDVATPDIWLLSDGHCFRSQVINLCDLEPTSKHELPFELEGGSIETLLRIINREGGFTIIPELAVNEMSESNLKNVVSFSDKRPLREVSICYSRHYVKRRLIDLLAEEIKLAIPAEMKDRSRGELVLWK